MKFIVRKASDYKRFEVELNTLEEFIKFVDTKGDDVRGIILNREFGGDDLIITIYDSYME